MKRKGTKSLDPRLSVFSLAAAALLVTWSVAAIVILVYVKLVAVSSAANQIATVSMPGVIYSNNYQSLSKHDFRLLLEHIIASDPKVMAQLEGEMKDADRACDTAEAQCKQVMTTTESRTLLDQCIIKRTIWQNTRDGILSYSRADKNDAAMQLYYSQTEPAFEAFVEATEQLEQYNQNEGNRACGAITGAVASTKTLSLVGVGIALVSAVLIVVFLRVILFPTLAFILTG